MTNYLPGSKTHPDTFPKISEYQGRRGKSFPKENKETLIYKELGIMSPSNTGCWKKMEQYQYQESQKKWLWSQSPFPSQISILVKSQQGVFRAYKPQDSVTLRFALWRNFSRWNRARKKESKKEETALSNGPEANRTAIRISREI